VFHEGTLSVCNIMTNPLKKWKVKAFNLNAHIKERLRDRFYRWPAYNATLQAARVEVTKYNKDGTESKRPFVGYICAHCQGEGSRKEVQVDHIAPVIPLDKTIHTITISELVARIFTENLQVLCKPCHKIKTATERKEKRNHGRTK